jgi:hypothetical protein
LTLGVGREIAVPEKLRLETKGFGWPERVPGPILRVKQNVVLKAADEDDVGSRFGEQAVRSAAQQIPKPFRRSRSAASSRVRRRTSKRPRPTGARNRGGGSSSSGG